MKGSNNKNNVLNAEHDMIIMTSPTEEKFLPYPFKLPRVSINQHPRKNRFRFPYKMGNKSPFLDISTDNSLHSPNSNLDYDSCIYKSIRILSRSAKIMRALSSTSSSFRHKDVGIRKLLNFDSTPSPKENSNYENSSSINTDTPSSTLNSSLTDSTDSNVPTVESIDENQNQTPQQKRRKHFKMSNNRIDIRENMCIGSRTFYLMSLLEKELKERTNKDANNEISFHPFCSFNPFNNGSNRSRVIIASTPRNLSQEFDQEIQDRPHTPENVINVIPESISAIKKSHKKEKLYCHEEQSSIQRTDVSIKNDDLYPRTVESSGIKDVIAEASATAENESQKKNKNTKRTLIYDDECSDIRSDLDRSIQQEITSMGTDLLESELKSNKMQDTDSNDCENHENMQVSIDLVDNEEEEGRSKKDCNEKVNELFLQNEFRQVSSSICNVSAMSENRVTSPESNPIISQNSNKVVTPENHVDVLTHMISESIKKSHKKTKHESRKKLFKSKDLCQEMKLENEISFDACNDDQNIKSQTSDMICASSSQNFGNDRPSTPEDVNSSRLLLHDFSSVKKLHKKNKHSKRTSSFAECHDYEYRKRSNDSLQNNSYKEKSIGTVSCMDESVRSLESPDISPKKKKKPTNMFLQSSTPKISGASISLDKSMDDEFKIYTPIKRRSILLTVTDYVPVDEMLQEIDEFAQSISNEIDCSRCVTPIARFKELKKNKDLSLERVTEFETDIRALKAVDTANLKDKDGRSTPINMSTTELLHDLNSIKKSHKKDKHNRSKRPTSEKKRSYNQKSGHVSFTNSREMLEECIPLSLHHVGDYCAEKEICNITREKKKNDSYKEIDYNNPQPSTSREADNIENLKNTTVSKFLNTTPPNSLGAMNFIKLAHTTSIKKSHKKERDMNAQTKYIFMSQEHELSDDGSIFDEEDRLSFMDISDNTKITTM